MGFAGWSVGLFAIDGPKVLAPADAGPSSGIGVKIPGLGFSTFSFLVPVAGPGSGRFAVGKGFGRGSAGLGGPFRWLLGVMGSTFAGDRGTVGTLGGGCASTTSARVKTVGGVSGSASGMGTGSGAGGASTSAGMRSERAVWNGDPQSSDTPSKPVMCQQRSQECRSEHGMPHGCALRQADCDGQTETPASRTSSITDTMAPCSA